MPCAVILGPAACGKTTLLNRIACGQARDALCGYLGALVPYVVPVMQFSSWLLANESSLPADAELVLEFICHRECAGAKVELYHEFARRFQDGNLALIFDGLDEAGKQLEKVASYIGQRLGSSFKGRIVVSSRAAYGPRPCNLTSSGPARRCS